MPKKTVASRRLSASSRPPQSILLACLCAAMTGAAAQDGQIQEVIVTAQKTAQPASKTPLALSVLGGEELRQAGATNAVALTELAPNVQISTDSGKLQIAIRGVVSLDTSEKGDSSTAFNVDGAYIGRSEAQLGSFLDLERIEVLRGPQGTLYGRNATAGAINLITNKPSGKLEGRVDAELGDYASRRVEGMLNIPVDGTLALRAAALTVSHHSYLRPGPNTVGLADQDDSAGRVHALFTFTPQTTWLLTAERSKAGGNGSSSVPLTNFFKGTPIAGGNNLLNPVYVDRGAEAQLTAAFRFANVGSHKADVATSLRSEFKTSLGGVAELTYQYARLHAQIDQLNNGSYFGFPLYNTINGESTQRSHELRLNSSGESALNWVAGVYRFNEDIFRAGTYYTVTPGPLIVLPFAPTIESRSKAAFGQLTYRVLKDLRVTLGARSTRDEKSGHDPISGSATGPGYSAHVASAKSNFRLAADYDVRPALMVYGSVSTGYKAGGFNDTSGAEYKPENLASVEAGVKGRFLGNRLRLSAAAFHYDYKDMQLTSVVCASGSSGADCGALTTNASNATVKGVELEGSYNATQDDRINLSFATSDGKFKSYRPNAGNDWSGQQIDRAPAYNASLAYAHTFMLASGASVVARAGTRLNGAYFLSDFAEAIRYRQPAYRKSDIAMTYTAPAQSFYVQVYARNLENTVTLDSLLPGGFGIGAPRTYGLRAGTQF
ncbi:TonB-dependent receptor [Pseudoduganella sp. LjRoot289]|uniref:TonB-dependent receptor n=1 Tax=Pseudoduganella sp. LjRoot289 TaxID=3342314 RepID=UPI003ED0C6D3